MAIDIQLLAESPTACWKRPPAWTSAAGTTGWRCTRTTACSGCRPGTTTTCSSKTRDDAAVADLPATAATRLERARLAHPLRAVLVAAAHAAHDALGHQRAPGRARDGECQLVSANFQINAFKHDEKRVDFFFGPTEYALRRRGEGFGIVHKKMVINNDIIPRQLDVFSV